MRARSGRHLLVPGRPRERRLRIFTYKALRAGPILWKVIPSQGTNRDPRGRPRGQNLVRLGVLFGFEKRSTCVGRSRISELDYRSLLATEAFDGGARPFGGRAEV